MFDAIRDVLAIVGGATFVFFLVVNVMPDRGNYED